MLNHVSGTLTEKQHTLAVVDIQGLGYQLFIPTSTFQVLPECGDSVRLLTHQHVREDALLLFGFATLAERSMFRAMIGISGVGPKIALAALSVLSPNEITAAVRENVTAPLTRIPGIGRKTAERLVLELRDRVDSLDLTGEASPGEVASHDAREDALAALIVLGMKRQVATRRIKQVIRKHPDAQTADALIRLALQN